MQIVRIYTLADARTPNEVRYVGKTVQSLKRRRDEHVWDAKKSCKTGENNHRINWIKHVLDEGSDIVIESLEEVIVQERVEWEILERYWISQFKCWGFNLVNEAVGGEGAYGVKPSKETIELRASKVRGIPRSDETKSKISASNKGVSKSETHKQHVKDTMTEKFGIPIVQLDKRTKEFIAEYPSITAAAEELGKSKANIAKCCKHLPNYNSAYGYIWMYRDEYIVQPSGKPESKKPES